MRKTSRLLMVGLLFPPLMAAGTAQAADASGKKIFTAHKCNTCHTLEAEGISKAKDSDEGEEIEGENAGDEPPDLSGVGQRFDAGTMDGWLRKKVAIDGAKHPKRFAGGDEERKVLIEWLLQTRPSAKAEPKGAPRR